MSIHEDAELDLDALYDEDEDGAAAIDVFLDEAASSQDILDRFTVDGYRSYALDSEHDFEVKRWKELWSRLGLLRLRLFGVPGSAGSHRIIYAFHSIERRYYILGIVPREFNYESDHPLSQRIIRAYRDLDIP